MDTTETVIEMQIRQWLQNIFFENCFPARRQWRNQGWNQGPLPSEFANGDGTSQDRGISGKTVGYWRQCNHQFDLLNKIRLRCTREI